MPVPESRIATHPPDTARLGLHEIAPSNPLQIEGGFSLQDLPLQSFGDTIPHTFEEGVGKIARADVEWKLRIPEELRRKAVAIIAPGYFAKEAVYDEVADALAGQGIAVATYKAVRKQGFGAGWHPKHLLHPERLVSQAPWGVIRDIRGRDDIDVPADEFTFVGHSMGGRTAAKNALAHPESVDGIIMIDAAGLENHNTAQMIGRLPAFGRKEVAPALASKDLSEAARLALNSFQYVFDSPLRTLAEGISIGNADIKPDIERLDATGIPVAVLLSAADTLVHTSNVLRDTEEIAASLSALEIMPNLDLGHLGPLRAPEEYGSAVLQILNYFDSRKMAASEQPDLQLVA